MPKKELTMHKISIIDDINFLNSINQTIRESDYKNATTFLKELLKTCSELDEIDYFYLNELSDKSEIYFLNKYFKLSTIGKNYQFNLKFKSNNFQKALDLFDDSFVDFQGIRKFREETIIIYKTTRDELFGKAYLNKDKYQIIINLSQYENDFDTIKIIHTKITEIYKKITKEGV